MIPIVEFTMNDAVHASTGYTSFYLNGLTPFKRYLYVFQGLVEERWPTGLLTSAVLLFKDRLARSSQRD